MCLAQITNRSMFKWISTALAKPVYALPVDILRVLVGLISFAYFVRTFLESRDFSCESGLIDHQLSFELFWYTRWSLLQPGITCSLFEVIFLLAAGVSWMLILGLRVKLAAGFLFLTASSAYRWNFLVIYVDDAIVHLMLLWVILLPVGHTLVLREWVRDRRVAVQRWQAQLVPGLAVRCFLANLALAYVVAGVWKWSSPMWRDGFALYAVLKLPVAYTPDLWLPEHLPALEIANYFALICEPLFPLMFLLPTNHRLKWLLLTGFVFFHAGILATLKIPFANIACLGAGVLVFRDELMVRILRRRVQFEPVAAPRGFDRYGGLSLLLVVALTLQVLSELRMPAWRFQDAPGSSVSLSAEESIDRPNGVAGCSSVPYTLFYVVSVQIRVA